MKNISMLITIIGLTSVGMFSYGSEGSLTRKQTAALDVASTCDGIVVNQMKFEDAVSSGEANPLSKAAVGASFNKKMYDKAIANGLDTEEATDFATTYKYSDSSKFCQQLRARIKAEIQKSFGQ